MESLEETNRMLGEVFREWKALHLRLCRAVKNPSPRRKEGMFSCGVHNSDLPPGFEGEAEYLLPRFCACLDRARALVGRLLVYANVSDPCCYPGPLDKPTKCGGMFRCDSARGQSTRRASR